LVEDGGAGDGVGDARADVVSADVAFEPGLLHEFSRLLPGTAEEQVAARRLDTVGEFFDGA
jgi:hypothetical protein